MLPLPVDPSVDVDSLDPSAQRGRGRDAAVRVPPSSLARFTLAAPEDRDVVSYVRSTHADRLTELLPLRLERMASSPFAFFRGSAGIMAADLAAGPRSGLVAQICGDAHANNFGLYGTDDGRIVMDINDFDETLVGPWEWDLKRLVTSVVLAGRESGASSKAVRRAAVDTTRAYRRAVKRLAAAHYEEAYVVMADEVRLAGHKELGREFAKAMDKARRNTSERVVDRSVEHVDDPTTGVRSARFVDDDPVLFHVDDAEAAAVMKGVQTYFGTLRPSRRPLLARYRMVDVAFRVVGTGSVGMRSYVVLLEGNHDDWLVLQVKQAGASALCEWVGEDTEVASDQGRRIVEGARIVQARTDHLMGSTTIGERPFLVRQFRNAKGSVDPLDLEGDVLDDYAQICAAILARAHTRTLHPSMLRGYLTGAKALDEAMADYAEAYADQVEGDHAMLVHAVDSGEFAEL